MQFWRPIAAAVLFGSLTFGQTSSPGNYKLALAGHKGQLTWTSDGFVVVQSSAKANGQEMGVRGRDASRGLSFLGFLFLVPGDNSLTSAACRDGAMAQEKSNRPDLKVASGTEIDRPDGVPLELVAFSAPNRDGTTNYAVRGFLASGDLCGDLEFDSPKPITTEDADLKAIFSTYRLDIAYVPQFRDMVLYAQILFETQSYKASADVLEKALGMVPPDGAPFPSAKFAKRIVTDQAGMAYGIAGDLAKARAVLEKGIADDPEYPLYYYNLACADAGEKKLSDARRHLQQAFERKANVNPGETMPDPLKDDSFLPYQSDKAFWTFLQGLRAAK